MKRHLTLLFLLLAACDDKPSSSQLDAGATNGNTSPGLKNDAGGERDASADVRGSVTSIPPTTTLNTYAELLKEQCKLLSVCCVQAGRSASTAVCESSILSLSSPYDYDPVAGRACLADMQKQAKLPDFCSLDNDSAACAATVKIKRGSVQPGAQCAFDAQCAPSPRGNVRCQTPVDSLMASTIGICRLEIVGKKGDAPCVGTALFDIDYPFYVTAPDSLALGYICPNLNGKGLRCGESGACEPVPPKTGSCAQFDKTGCEADQRCNLVTGACAAKQGYGDSCTYLDDCESHAFCDESRGTCQPRNGEGATCAEDVQCLNAECKEGKCGPDMVQDVGWDFLCEKK